MADIELIAARAGVRSQNDQMPVYSSRNIVAETISNPTSAASSTVSFEDRSIAGFVSTAAFRFAVNATATSSSAYVAALERFEVGDLEAGDYISFIVA